MCKKALRRLCSFLLAFPKHTNYIKFNIVYAKHQEDKSLENQLLLQINKTPIYYNYLGNYKELAKQYDHVVVATGRETEARDMGVWQDEDAVAIIGGTALGSFDINSSTIYFNTEYAGTGYGRVTPMNQQCAVVGLYIFGRPEIQALKLFQKFIQMEGLDKLEYLYKYIPPVFITGKVTEFQKDNVILTGVAAGLVDRVLGVGAVEAMVSGTLAARAIAWKKDYTSMVKPLQTHIESISAFRKSLNKFDNDDFDKAISVLGTPGIKQAVYNTSVNFVGMAGSILKRLNKS